MFKSLGSPICNVLVVMTLLPGGKLNCDVPVKSAQAIRMGWACWSGRQR